ncbi:hypothetical protein LAZ67_7002403 [Cordylochernes scorpioides]|uniref:Uncharacterized protein n=1 Tax=Cordylochernes scorpioides TaxID=51811 RepID=A0ABY6KN49_9ARAC|nr:hypothetical protein LAZ67_7002403 [Cordylochernes scorpioides]
MHLTLIVLAAYWDCGLSLRIIDARVGRDPKIYLNIESTVQDSQYNILPAITNSRESRNVTLMTLLNRTVTSRATSLKMESFTTHKCLHEELDGVCSVFHYINDESAFNAMINDELGRNNGMT